MDFCRASAAMTRPMNSGLSLLVMSSQPAAAALHHGLGADESWVERNDTDAMSKQLVRHVSREFIGGRFRDAIDDISNVLLRRPITDIHDQSRAPGHHHPCCKCARDERGADAGIHHAAPAMCRLLPERRRPRIPAVFDHFLVTAPNGVYKQIQTAGFRGNLAEYRSRVLVSCVITGYADNTIRQVGRRDTPCRRVDSIAMLVQCGCNTPTDPATRACDQCCCHAGIIFRFAWRCKTAVAAG